MKYEEMKRQASNNAFFERIKIYEDIGISTPDASVLAEIGQMAFRIILVKADVEKINGIVKKYPEKEEEIKKAIKNNFPSYVEVS